MSIPVQIVAEGIDWPAWFQAVGSVVAIGAAVWIDQGAARRARAARLTEIADRIADWQRALEDGMEALELAAVATPRITPHSVHPDSVDKPALLRMTRNAGGMLDLYLATEPPNPHLGWAVVAMRTELKALYDAVDGWRRDNVISAHIDLPLALDESLAAGRAIMARYRGEAS